MDIFGDIYDEVQLHMQENGMSLPLKKEDYLSLPGKDPFVIEMKDYKDLTDRSKFDALFYRLFNCISLKETLELYREEARILGVTDQEDIDHYIMFALCRSPEIKRQNRHIIMEKEDAERKKKYRKMRIRLYINYYFGPIRNGFLEKIAFPIWEAFPKNGKAFIRKAVGRDGADDDLH